MTHGPILVTGSRGFLGRFLVEELRRRGLGPRLKLHDRSICDLHDATSLHRFLNQVKPTLVYHLAGSTKRLSLEALWTVHPQATINLMEGLRRRADAAKIRVWVAGSAAEFGDVSKAGKISEEQPLRPVSPYGMSKWCQSLAALSYRGYGLKASIARIFNVAGPGMPDNLSLGSFAAQIARIEKGKAAPRLRVGNLSPLRDYVDVRDVARALADLGTLTDPKESYNVCSGRGLSIKDLLGRLLKLSPAKIALVRDPALSRAKDVRACVGSPRLIAKAVGWKPRIPIEQSLRDTLEWCRARA